MFRGRTFRVLSGLLLLVVFFTGQVIAASPQKTESTVSDDFLATQSEFFVKRHPYNGTTNLPISNISIKFSPHVLDESFEYCIDTVNNNRCDTSWKPTISNGWAGYFRALPGTTYYWQVRTADKAMYANNSSWWWFRTTAKSSNKPDLRITGIDFTPSAPFTPSRLDITVKNFGSATASAPFHTVSVYVDETPDSGGRPVGGVTGGCQGVPIDPNEELILCSFDDIPELASGQHQIYAVVDSYNDIAELNENNNIYGTPQVSHIEITQAIQDETNGVPLVAEKPTFVRVYVDCQGCSNKTITGLLHVYRDGQLLGSQPPINASILPRHETWQDQRGNLTKTLNYELPASWTYGNIKLVASVEGSQKELYRSFVETRPLTIEYIAIRHEGHIPDPKDMKEAIEFAEKTYPTYKINYWFQNIDWEWKTACPNDPLSLCKLIELSTKLNSIFMLGGDTNKADYLFGWLPNETLFPMIGGYRTLGMGINKAAFGVALRNSNTLNSVTFAHEIGHLMGRTHTNTIYCDDKVNWPFTDNWPYETPSIQQWGLDGSKYPWSLKNPNNTADIMSYCEEDRWVSPATYEGIMEKLKIENSTLGLQALADESSSYFMVSGLVFSDDTAVLYPIREVATTENINPPTGTNFCVAAEDTGGEELSEYCFDLDFVDYDTGAESNVAGFNLALLKPTGAVRIVLRKGELELASRIISSNSPQITLLTPNGGENWDTNGDYTVTWSASDVDGDSLLFNVFYSIDGVEWSPLGMDITDSQLAVNTTTLSGSDNAYMRVEATDGVNISHDDSDASFMVGKKHPQVIIELPKNDGIVLEGSPVTLRGYATDMEDGTLEGENLTWSSSLDGDLGTGESLIVNLTPGQHTITLHAVDSDGNVSMAETTVSTQACYLLTAAHTGQGEDPIMTPAYSTGCPDGHFIAGEQVQLTASPDMDWEVEGWNGTDNDSYVTSDNYMTMGAAEKSVSVSYTGPVTIFGNAGIDDATLSYEKNGVTLTATTDMDGNYIIVVPYDWSGTVTPSKIGYTFTPESLFYSSLTEDKTLQDYTTRKNTYYAKPGGSLVGSCDSWATACELKYALANAVSGNEIWVAAGTYIPGNNRGDSFQLKNGVELYGGFIGTEHTREQRNYAVNETILSGDLSGNDQPNFVNRTDNSYHVVTGSGVDGTAILDGFTISGGYANGSMPNNFGAGMYIDSGSPTVRNLIFSNNRAFAGGGGGLAVFNNSAPDVSDVTFNNNSAVLNNGWGGWGGAAYIEFSNGVKFTRATFSNNETLHSSGELDGWGGAMYIYYCSPTFTNVIFDHNRAEFGGGIINDFSSPVLDHVTFSQNTAATGGGFNNNGGNPVFTHALFTGNSATESGGGFYANGYSGTPSFTNVSFLNNSAGQQGGGIHLANSAKATISNATFITNSASYGGAIYNAFGNSRFGSLTLTNVTFSGNMASNDGGGMYNYDTAPIITNVTFYGNSAGNGGALYNLSNSCGTGCTVYMPVIRNSIFWGNTATTGTQISNSYIAAPIISNSIVQNGCPANSTCSNVAASNPLLGSLGNHGGFSNTIPLLAGSPAVNAGDSAYCPSTDQRGAPRSNPCDLGAFEYESPLISLTVNKGGTGNGAVTSNLSGINCGIDCSEGYPYNATISLNAVPAIGSAFTGWSGACTGTDSCVVSMTEARTVTANFELNTYALGVTKAGAGAGVVASNPPGINCGSDCSEDYNYNTSVTLTATPTAGSTFTGWSGACSGTGSCIVSMTVARSVTATFSVNIYTLTVNKVGAGSGTVTSTPLGINCGADCSENYNYNTSVTLTATPATGSTFTGWSGACTGTGSCVVSMIAAKSATATFSINTYALTVSKAGTGSGTVISDPSGISCGTDCLENYNYNTSITLAAAPATGSTFTGWSGACTGIGVCAVTMETARSVVASFYLTPTVSMNSSTPNPTNASPIPITVTFSSSVTGFTADDITVGNATVDNFAGSGASYTFGLIPIANGLVNANIAAGVAQDSMGISNIAAPQFSRIYDTIAPDTTIDSQPPSLDNDTTPTFTFSGNDGTGSGVGSYMCKVDDGNYTACTSPFTAPALSVDGSHTFNVKAVDNASNEDATSASYTWVLDATAPTVISINRAGPASFTNLTNVDFTVNFSEPVTGVGIADFKLTNTILTGASITGVIGTDAGPYTVTINTGTGNGTIRLDVRSTVSIQDLATNALVGPYSGGEVYTIEKSTAPTVPVLASPANGALVTSYTPTLDWKDSSEVMALEVPGWHYEINVTSPFGYNETFNTADNADPLIGLGLSQYTFITALPESTSFTWKVRAYNDQNQYSAWSSSRTFRTPPVASTTKLPAPTLTSPLNSITLNNKRPTFIWEAVSGATSYTLQILNGGKVVNTGTIKAPLHSYTPTKDLLPSSLYTWQVKANGKVSGDYSTPFTFITSANPPAIPILVALANKALVDSAVGQTLRWKLVSGSAASYEVEYATDAAFSDSETGTISGTELSLPAGSLLPNRTYYWRVRSWSEADAKGNHSTWSAVRAFRTKLETPVLNLPENKATLDTIRPTFSWDEVPGATTYTLQVLKDGKVVVTGNIKVPAYVYIPVKDLLPSTTYTWKVKANGTNAGNYSAPYTFTTSANPPKAPILSAPANNVLVDSTAAQAFKWTTTLAAASYEVEYATNAGFINSSPTVKVNAPSTETAPITLLPGRTYYWRVRSWSGVNATGNHSAWSAARTIKVKFVVPTLTSPAGGDANVPARPTFTWSSENGLWTFYTLQIAPDNTFGKGTRTIKVNAPVTKYTIPASLPDLTASTQYCWRVKINGLYSPVQSTTVNCFTTTP